MRPAKARARDRHQGEDVHGQEMRDDTKRTTAMAGDAASRSESSANRLLRWLKKSVGIQSSTTKKKAGGLSQQRRQRSLSFVFEKEREPTEVTSSMRSQGPHEDRKHHTTGSGSHHVQTLECPPPTFPRSIHDYPNATPVRRHSKAARMPHVLIVGGGIGGLCLAQGLKKLGIRFTVFERDPSPNFTTQGYRVQINTAGYEALKATLPKDKFELFLHSAGVIFPSTMTRDAHSGRMVSESRADSGMSTPDPSRQVFSVNRSMLRALLLSDLEEGTEIKYDMAFKRFHVLPNGIVEVHFDNGRFTQGTMLVGADGTASRVRQQFLSRHIKVFDTDSGVIYGKTALPPDLRSLGLAPDTTTVITSQNPKMTLIIEPQCSSPLDLTKFPSTDQHEEGSQHDLPDLHKYVCWVLIARLDKFCVNGVSAVEDLYSMSSQEVADVAMELTASWDPQMRLVVDMQAREWASFMRISTMAPKMRAWTPSVVTLMGDAAHTMPPAGFGCNSAVQDARDLCNRFQEEGVTVEAVAKYEKSMRARVRGEIQVSIQVGHELYDLPSVESMDAITSWP